MLIVLVWMEDHGLRTPNEAFFSSKSKLFGLDRQFGNLNFGAFGIFFGQFISTHFGAVVIR
jgi:hypothetical protein